MYQSIGTERQRSEIYVRPFPSVDTGRWQISTAGGSRAVWGRNGRELFYLDASNTLTAVSVQTSKSRFTAGAPTKVFQAKYSTKYPPRPYDVSPDGRRFLMIKDYPNEDQQAGLANMIVVEHWVVELQQRLSANGR